MDRADETGLVGVFLLMFIEVEFGHRLVSASETFVHSAL